MVEAIDPGRVKAKVKTTRSQNLRVFGPNLSPQDF